MWCVCIKDYLYGSPGAVEEMMCVVCVGVIKGDRGCDLASTLCRYDLRKGG